MFRKWLKSKPDRIYLDYAAATPVHPGVLVAMQPYFVEQFGNASAIHTEGAAAATAVSAARQSAARTLGIRPPEIIFTSSGSESNNLALLGYVRQLVEVENVPYKDIEIISTAIEHPSVSEVLNHLMSLGVVVRTVSVDALGLINTTELGRLFNKKTRLLTFAYANSEIGTIQDVKRIIRLVKKYNTEHQTHIKVHLDAAQAPLWLPCQVPTLGVDMMSLDAGKCLGPKGVGILTVRNVALSPVIFGGGQEVGRRAGTENTAGIVGAAAALELAQDNWKMNNEHVRQDSELLWQSLAEVLPDVVLNGPTMGSEDRLPNNVHISLPGIDTEFAVVVLDKHGIAASTKSACSGAGGGESTVVKAISSDAARSSSTIRFSLGPTTDLQPAQAQRVAEILRQHVTRMKPFSKL